MEPWGEGDLGRLWRQAMAWSLEYAEHNPDWADAYIVALCGRHRGLKVWTYDEEFRRVWRRADGSGVPMAV
jgi:predicted nucleic acid-binding protein